MLSGCSPARRYALPVDQLTNDELRQRFPGFRVPDQLHGVFEHRAGYLRVEACVRAHLEAARRAGAETRHGEQVLAWRSEGIGIRVETTQDTYWTDRLVIAAGSWSQSLLAPLRLNLRVVRKPQYWLASDNVAHRVDAAAPTFLFEPPAGMFYGFPQIDEQGVKIACHSGGSTVDDPMQLDREIDRDDLAAVEAFAAEHLPGISPRPLRHSVCMYTLTPDAHFVVDRHPASPQVVFAAGLSGHGFKFTGVLGQALAELALDGTTSLPIEFLHLNRPGLVG